MEIGAWDEGELVRRCKEGSEAAFAELVRRHRPRLFSLAVRLVGERDAAEDILQETFVAAFRAIDRFEPRPSLAAWLNTILIRLAGKSAVRLEKRGGTSLDRMLETDETVGSAPGPDMAPPTEHDPAAAAEAAELRRELTRAISALPFTYRAAVVTRFVMEMDYAEAAASLAVNLNTYKSHLLRGTRMLREALDAERAMSGTRAARPSPTDTRPISTEARASATDARPSTSDPRPTG